jgi:hypothetical protein
MNDPISLTPDESYEEPILLGAEDLEDVNGGCIFSCSDGDCKPKT